MINVLKKIEFTKIILSTLFFLVIFYKLPIDVYYFNRDQFNNFSFILIPNLIIFSISLIFFKKIYNNKLLLKILLTITVYILISKTLLPLNINELDGHLELARENKYGIFIEIFSLITSYIIVKNIYKEFIKKFIILTAIIFFLFSSYYYLISFGSTIKNEYNYFITKSLSKEKKQFNSKPNVYLLTFDAFSSHAFEKVIQKNNLKSIFNGFTFYKNNSSNYSHTSLSVNSFITGTMHDFNSSILEWKDGYRKQGLISEMQNRNYDVWQYLQSDSMQHRDVKKIKTNVSLILERSKLKIFIEFSDYLLLRLSPQFLHQEIYNNGSGIVSKIMNKIRNDKNFSISGEHYRAIGSKFLFEELIKEEKLRPTKGVFVHAHIYLPHAPYVLDEKAEYLPKIDDSKTGIDRYQMQVEGVVFLLNKFLETLKQQNKFKDSLIILNSDHGSWTIGLKEFPLKYKQRINEIRDNQRRFLAHYIFNQSKSLLTIKYPITISTKKLVINEKKTQLLDIFPTIINFSDGNLNAIKNSLGISLLKDENVPKDRKTKFIVGYKQRKTINDQWITIDKTKGGVLDVFEISNENFISKLESKYTKW